MKIIKYFFLCLSLLATFNIFAADEDPRPLVSIDTSWIKDKSQVKGANFTTLINRLNHELIQTGIYRVVDYADTAEILKKVDEYTVISDEDGMETSIKIPHSYIRLTVVPY